MKLAKFWIGQCLAQPLSNYRGVIVDADPGFPGQEGWYQAMTCGQPPWDEPCYRVLVHDTGCETRVAERKLREDDSNEPVNPPLPGKFFTQFECDNYQTSRHVNWPLPALCNQA